MVGVREIALVPDRYRHVDHAYAVTLQKSAILLAPVQPVQGKTAAQERSYGRASYMRCCRIFSAEAAPPFSGSVLSL